MAITRTETQVTWAASNSSSVAAAGNDTSDAVSISSNAINGAVYVKASNGGTPTSGDELTVKLLYTGGDTDADPDTADEYETAGSAAVSAVIDTNADNNGVVKIPVDVAAKGFQVYAENAAASNPITVSAQYVEQTAS